MSSRFVEETVFGILSGGSVRLTEIGWALEEKIPLHATHKRLSRNLVNEDIEEEIGAKVLEMRAILNHLTLTLKDNFSIFTHRKRKFLSP